jgi:TorA maturation chaperone TorD
MNTTPARQNMPPWFGPHNSMRTDAYVLLAALLRDSPTPETIDLLRNLSWDEDLPLALQMALSELCRAGAEYPMQSILEEYQRIFMGLGSGELVPYASWYVEKMIQSTPLAEIRGDLLRLAIVRQTDCFESEDHVGVLCEIMALLSAAQNEIPLSEQAVFFNHHLATWMPLFFKDLQGLRNIRFYRTVAEFGRSFLEAETAYLQNAESYEKYTSLRHNQQVSV